MAKVCQIPQRLAIGSAQFGLDYGVSNSGGKVPSREQEAILSTARAAGITLVDTAKSYGDAESALGAHAGFNFVSKVSGLEERKIADAKMTLLREVEDSLEKLRVKSLHGLLLHRETDLLGPRGREIWDAMMEAKARGWVKKLGVSSHNPENFRRVLDAFPLEIAQVPVNALDRRFLADDLVKRYEKLELHARSLFLQGFFFFRPEKLPPFLGFAKAENEALWEHAGTLGVTPAQLSLGFAASLPFLNRLVFAVTSEAELREILDWPLIILPKEVDEALASEGKRSGGRLQDPLLWGMPPR